MGTSHVMDANEISEHVWCGATLEQDDLPALERIGIKRVINLETYLRYFPEALVSKGIDFVSVPVPDIDQPLGEKFIDEVVASIEETAVRGGKVYVHCTAGWQRSPALVACYLVYRGLPAERALAVVKQKRPVARFYPAHIASVMRYEARLRKGSAPQRANDPNR